MKTARTIGNLAAVLSILASTPTLAQQRVQFATPVQSQPPQYNPATPTLPGPVVQGMPMLPGTPAVTSPPSTTFAQPSPQPFAPPPGTAFGPQAPATLNGSIQPPPASFDPYAPPGAASSPLLPQDPYFQGIPAIDVASMQRFIQHVDLDYHWFVGNGDRELGINDVELSVTCALPMFFNSQTPLRITPGFAVHYWAGPVSIEPLLPTDPAPADLPPRTYDAYLDAAWNPQLTPWFGGELDVRYGVYSDFTRVASDSLRLTGKGLAVLTFSPSIKIKAGMWYLNRNVIKILPAGGICWTPNPDIYFDILFPNPKVGKRLTTLGNTQWWLYFSGDYGGGKWAVKRQNDLPPNPFYPDTNDTYDTFDYNDIRVAVGLEFSTLRQLHGMFEVGGAFSRELVYQSTLPPAFYPHNTVFLRAGLAY